MEVHQHSDNTADAGAAVGACLAGLADRPAPDVVFAFTAGRADLAACATHLAAALPNSLLVGCSSAGQYACGHRETQALSVTALSDTGATWHAALIDDLATLTPVRAHATVARLLARAGVDPALADPRHHVGMLFIDGLSRAEERVAEWLADALGGVPLVGGSAGDDLRFETTQVLLNGEARSDAAVLLLGHVSSGEFVTFKHQHFTGSNTLLAVTAADPDLRRVYRLDGYPARDAYAWALGVEPTALTAERAFLQPVTLNVDGVPYVRSVQQVHADGSMTFYCAVKPGDVLEVAAHGAQVPDLGDALGRLGGRPCDFLFSFNCILRALEADQYGLHADLQATLARHARVVAGFDTYGEQYRGVHINQTLVAVGLRCDP